LEGLFDSASFKEDKHTAENTLFNSCHFNKHYFDIIIIAKKMIQQWPSFNYYNILNCMRKHFNWKEHIKYLQVIYVKVWFCNYTITNNHLFYMWQCHDVG
jgi:hypothetical protein